MALTTTLSFVSRSARTGNAPGVRDLDGERGAAYHGVGRGRGTAITCGTCVRGTGIRIDSDE